MNDRSSDSSPYSVPREPGRWRAIALAAIVHAALLALLWFGVSWQSETPVAVEAEVWSAQAMEAARKAPPPPPPEPEVPPPPQPKPQPLREAPPPVEVPVQKAPDIALEREKKRLEQRKEQARIDALQAEAQRRQRQQQAEQAREQKRIEQARNDKQVAARQAAEQKLEQKRDQERAAQAAEAAAKKKTDDAKKLAVEKQRKLEAAENQKLEAQRADQLRRLTDSASASTSSSSANVGSGGSGDAARSQGARADASYTQKVGAKIKSNTVFNGGEELSSNPAVEYAVELLPDGSIRRLRKIKASGVPGFDEAVSRAIEKSQPFPPDKSGSAPSGFTVSHKPKDQ